MSRYPTVNTSGNKSRFIEMSNEKYDRIRIGDVCDLVNGRAFKPSEWKSLGLPIVRIQNLNDPSAEYHYYDGSVEERFIIDNGDLLFSWSGTPGTSFGSFIWLGDKAILNQHIFKVKEKPMILRTFLKISFDANIDRIITKAHGGAGLKHITKSELENIEITLPPLEKQKYYVAFMEHADKSGFIASNRGL